MTKITIALSDLAEANADLVKTINNVAAAEQVANQEQAQYRVARGGEGGDECGVLEDEDGEEGGGEGGDECGVLEDEDGEVWGGGDEGE